MGNRAVITGSVHPNAPAIYLHWNGGRASVEAFLSAARHLSIRGTDAGAFDQLAELVARHYFGGDVGMTVYRERFGKSDPNNGDNGTYVINNDLDIIERLWAPRHEEIDAAKTAEIFEHIVQQARAFNGGAS